MPPTDSDLAALGIHRIPCPVPFAAAGGPANVYALEEQDGGLALFDSGLATPEGERAVREGLAALGRTFSHIRRIVLSHGHIDHYGLSGLVAQASGAPVHVHEADRPKIERRPERYAVLRAALHERLRRLGCDDEDARRIEQMHRANLKMAPVVPALSPLADGTTLRFARFEAVVLHRPGHTPGLCCLHVPAHGLLFSSDHLLERVSPNPLLEAAPGPDGAPFEALVWQLRSLAQTRAMALEAVLPGHGPPFAGHGPIIDSLLGFYERRQARMLAALAPEPPTAAGLVRRLFPRAAKADLFLTLSEIAGNLEVLGRRGLAERFEDAGRERWRPVSAATSDG